VRREEAARLLARLIHVRRAELDRALRMSLFALVLGWAMYVAFNATQAIFLTVDRPHAYPVFFILLALSVWPAVTLQAALTRRLGVSRAFRYNLLANSGVALLAYAAYRLAESNPVVPFAAYVAYSVAFELVMLHFWAFVSQYFNLLEGKRIYPVIAAGTSVGYILSGYTTTLVALWSTEALMFVWAAGTALAAWLVHDLEQRLFRPADDEADEFMAEVQVHPRKSGLAALPVAVGYLRSSRLVLGLVVLALSLILAMRASDYVVALVFVQSTHNLQELTILLGYAWLLSYVVQLFLALFATPPLLARLGVKNAILALPVATLLGFAAVALSPVLATAVFLFVVRNGLQTGVDDPAENVLSSALPGQVLPKLKLLMDNLVLPGGALLAGVLLLAAQALLGPASVVGLALGGIAFSLLFLAAALYVRQHYLQAIHDRLRTHTISLSDLEQALGHPDQDQIDQLKEHVRDPDPGVRRFAAAGLARVAPTAFAEILPELMASDDAFLRRLAFQLGGQGLAVAILERGAADADPWVVASAAAAGAGLEPPWERSRPLLERLWRSRDREGRAAAVWAAAALKDEAQVLAALSDDSARVRLEGIRSFAKLKGQVAGAGGALVARLRDRNLEVRWEALGQAVRWKPAAGELEAFVDALLQGLGSPDGTTRRLAGEALSVQYPAELERALPLLSSTRDTGTAVVEALLRSGRRELVEQAHGHLGQLLQQALAAAGQARRLEKLAELAGAAGEDIRFAGLRLALEDFQNRVAEVTIAALRALHSRRGFANVERGLRSDHQAARAEAVETLLNLGPGSLVRPLLTLLDPDALDPAPARPLGAEELRQLEGHHDRWIKQAAATLRVGVRARLRDLIALRRVPLFATLTLDQLAEVNKLMVSRTYQAGETIFHWGERSSEMYVITEGEVRIHRDQGGNQATLATLGPNTFMGEMALFDEQPRSAGAEAVTACTVRVLSQRRLDDLVRDHPAVLMELVVVLTRRVQQTTEQLALAGGNRSGD